MSDSLKWTATSEKSWTLAKRHALRPVTLREALEALFSHQETQYLHSPLANLVLMNALLQRLYLSRQMQLQYQDPLRDADAHEIQ